jgi:hypothetical protein
MQGILNEMDQGNRINEGDKEGGIRRNKIKEWLRFFFGLKCKKRGDKDKRVSMDTS